MSDSRVVLTLSCPDQVGIVAAVSNCVAQNSGWIVESAHHSEAQNNRFFMREEIVFSSKVDAFIEAFTGLAKSFEMDWNIDDLSAKRIAVLVGHEEHCLYDLLSRQVAGDLGAQLSVVISNHPELKGVTEWHGIDFHQVGDKDFSAVDRLLTQYDPDVVVLARYMQILPEQICRRFRGRMINIHHSFLPSFKGAKPYHQAHERGVKLIGATCHYVTDDLDEGPIIEQDVIRIDHSDSVDNLRRAGRDIEKAVLARGLRWHVENRILLNGHRTVVFR